MLNRTILGFAGGAVGFLVFATALWVAFRAAGYIPADATSPWWTGGVPPFGIPRVVSNAFWGGLWGALLSNLLAGTRGAAYWIAWISLGSVALSLVSLFVVPPLKGMPVGPLTTQRLLVQFTLAAAWGLGCATTLKLLGAAPSVGPASALSN